jgi:alpha-beta hydrolase superfamily lysophospholipase
MIQSFFHSGWENIYFEKMEISWVPCVTLVMHWAGQWDISRTIWLRNALLHLGIPTLAIDFSGHGKSSSNFPRSIAKRISEARDAIRLLDMDTNISLIGFSMSGEVSVRLTDHCLIQNLILFAPWIYHRDVVDMPFDENFTRAIRSHESWRNNAIWDILDDFQWNILLFTPELDTVIPEWVNEIIMDVAPMANKERVIIKDAIHMVWKWMNENPTRIQEIAYKIKQLYT